MPTDDRKDAHDEIRPQANPPVDDLSPTLDEGAAKQVKGGSTAAGGDTGRANFDVMTITKSIDRSSP